jgi:glycine cleavage system H protein
MLTQKETLGTVESVKAVSEIYSPMSGEVIEVNVKLVDAPELVNKQPYGEGWLILMRPAKLQEEIKSLLSATDYEALLKSLSEEK